MKTQYVLGIVIDPRYNFVVGITKKKGPSFLLNKITFPGGKMESGESPCDAMSRELAEEVGVTVLPDSWVQYETSETDDYVLIKLAAISVDVLKARQLEVEPVWHLAVTRHLEFAKAQPDQYAPDFIATLVDAVSALGLTQVVAQPECC